jgi:sigma-B regulation protein RsbU (phosphoserine phosphatase)
MTMTRSLLRAAAEGETSPGRTVETVNRLLGPDMTAGMFVTLVYALLDATTREVKLVRCGHNAPLLFSARSRGSGDGVTALQPRGLGIGIDRSGSRFRAELQTQTIELHPGDALLLYTDGVVEAKDRDGNDYGDERLRRTFATRAGSPAVAVLEAVLADVAAHRRGAEQSDDVTLLVLKAT